MIKPGEPIQMWAVHDKLRDTYAHPIATHLETRLMRDLQLAHLHPRHRTHMFPVVPVNVIITPRPYNAGELVEQPTLPALFPATGSHETQDA